MSAQREGLSIRDIARHAGLGPTRVHQLVTGPQAETEEPALSVLRETGWPAPEDPQPDTEEEIADRLEEEAALLTTCAGWLETLATSKYPPMVNLRPDDDWPDTLYKAVDQDRVIHILQRIAHDLEELARVRRVADLSTSAEDVDPRLRLRRRLTEPPIEISFRGMITRQSRQAWEDYERHLQKAGLPVPVNPYRHFDRSGI